MPSKPHSEKAPLGLTLSAIGTLLFLHVPLFIIFLYAFTTDEATYSFPLPGLTTKWFGVALHRSDLWAALRLSVQVAVVSTLVALIVVLPALASGCQFAVVGDSVVSISRHELRAEGGWTLANGGVDIATGREALQYLAQHGDEPVVISLGLIFTLQQFDLFAAITSGGPNDRSNVAQYWAWDLSFRQYDFAQGATISVVMIVFVMVASVVYVRSTRHEVRG